MEQKRARELRREIERLEHDVQSADGSKVLLLPEERERLAEVQARLAELRRLLADPK